MRWAHALLGSGLVADGSRPNNVVPMGGDARELPDVGHSRCFGSLHHGSNRQTALVDRCDAHLPGAAVPVPDRRTSDTVVIIQGRGPAVLEAKDAVLHTHIALTGGILE
jgi:hypothetical protein